MPLSVNQPLWSDDIKTIHPLKAGIVFAVYGFVGDELVLKLEEQSAQSYQQAGKIVKQIDPTARAYVLNGLERNELHGFCNGIVEWERELGDIEGGGTSKETIDACEDIMKSLGKGWVAVKMQKLQVMDLEHALKQRYEHTNKQPLRDFCMMLRKKEGLERLGWIMAGDAFIGNSDRFSYQFGADKTLRFGSFSPALKVLNNLGNVMWTLNQGKGQLSMLDYVDAGSTYRQWAPLTDNREKWPGYYFLDQQGREKWADAVVDDLETLLSPKRAMLSKRKLGKDAKQRVADGILTGMNLIVARLERKVKNNNKMAAQGMIDRWIVWRGRKN